MWNTVDVLLTANPNLINEHPSKKIVVQYVTPYNNNVNHNYKITKLGDFDKLINEIEL